MRFENDLLVYLDGSVGAGFKISGFDISCASPEKINSFTSRIENFLKGLPEDVRLQIFYRVTGDAGPVIAEHEAISEGAVPPYESVRAARSDFLHAKLNGGHFYVPQIFVFVRSAPLRLRKRKFFERREKFEAFPEKEFADQKRNFETLRDQIESALRFATLSPVRVSEAEWYKLNFEYLNFDRAKDVGLPDFRGSLEPLAPSLNSQLALTDISIGEKSLRVDNTSFRAITLALLPENETFASMVDGLTKLPFHCWISQNIRTLDQRKEIQKLEVGRRIANSMASGNGNVSDIESESKLSSLEDLLRDVMAGSEKLISSDFNVIFWDANEDELDRKCQEILRAFRSAGQSEGLIETFALEDVFFSAAPSVCEGVRRKKMKTSNCAHLMPLFASWSGNGKPVVLLSNREGAPFKMDVFDPAMPAWNGIIVGGTGSGKSFTISQLMLQFFGQKPRPKIVWIDNGASSQKLLEVLGGQFVDLNLDSGIRLNMFDPEPGETRPTSARIKLVLGCLEMILKEDDKVGLPKRDKALIEEAIFDCYREVEGRVPQLSDLRALLKRHPMPEMHRYADILFSWTGNTAFGRMLDGQTNINLSNDLVAIELKGLDNFRELKDIFLLLLTSYCKDDAASDLSRPHLCVIDEAQRLFKGSPTGREYAIDSFRTARKYFAGIWCISQNYRDFLSDSELADSLMPNTTFLFILRQRKIDWDDFRSTFDFDEAQVEAVKSLEIVKGKYSEFFLLQDENSAVVRLEPEPLSYWICTTDGVEKSRIQEFREEHPNLPLVDVLATLAKGETH